MEMAVNESLERAVDNEQDHMVPDSNNRGSEPKEDFDNRGSEPKEDFDNRGLEPKEDFDNRGLEPIEDLDKRVSEPIEDFDVEEIRRVLEVIASTGNFWHDWDKLKSMLSFQLKQVLLEYPEAEMPLEQQNASLGETYPELVKRLNEELLSFVQGPPFTLQRLCEILLAARSIYPNLSKLASALEKNLLVTSTLTPCTDPYPQRAQTPAESEKINEETQVHTKSVENGTESQPMVGDGDEIMTEVEETEIDDEMTIDMDALEEMVGPHEPNPVAAAENS